MRRLHGERGVAMLMALVTMLLLSILAGELVYQSGVYSSVVFKERDKLRATLLARSGLRIAMLQLRAAKKAKIKAKEMGLGENATITDKIWQTPLILPPPPIPGLSDLEQGTLNEFKKSLGLEGQVSAVISGSNDRMSINSLVWLEAGGKVRGAEGTAASGNATGGVVMDPNNPLGNPNAGGAAMNPEQRKEQLKKSREAFAEIFDGIFEKKRQDDNAFREKYSQLTGANIVADLAAWMDPETKDDSSGRSKNEYYSSVQPSPYSPKEAPIASESEYPMIRGFDDTIAKLVSDNFTVQSTSSLDVNKASLLLLGSLIPELNDGDALERIERRRKDAALGGEFTDAADFWNFVGTLGNYDDAKKKFEEKGIKILESETSYRVVVSAESGMAKKTWIADVGQLPPKEAAAPGAAPAPPPVPAPQSTSTSTNTSTNTESSDIDSLNILYLRAD